ncbi:hypothetical protein JI57_03005 [Psychromonas sp. PRT-SC03]|nr:hypothetical protein JI57_03005 [Psychromonas sp. PRT-SC03]
MKLLISLDYELFFGDISGSVEECLLKPTQAIIRILQAHNIKLSLFVDAGFLCKLEEYSAHFPELLRAKKQIKKQLLTLSEQGHDIQLHIHPHWQDSYYDGKTLITNTQRYRLHDFSEEEQLELVQRYKQTLQKYSTKPIFAFRAGGWCLQPFSQISRALKENGIWLDSTVFNNGFSNDPTRFFNFKEMPNTTQWQFNEDPLQVQNPGNFCEIPISSVKTSPLFFWKLAFLKIFHVGNFNAFGNDHAMQANNSYYLQRLTTTTTYGPVTIDGAKAGQLQSALQQFEKNHKNKKGPIIFNMMGHPKASCPYSLQKLDLFLKRNPHLISITYQDIKRENSE